MILAVLAVFGQAVSHGFVYDDFAIFSSELWRPPYTRPLTLLSFRIDLATGPEVGHGLNIALHAANTMLLLEVLQRWIPLPAARVAALVFALHPLQAEPVNYIWARSTLLMTFFCLLSLRHLHTLPRALVFFALALLSKEECVAFPLVVLLLSPGVPKALIGTMLAMSGAAGAFTWWAANTVAGSQAGGQALYTPLTYLATQGLVILRYLQLLVFPLGPFTVEPSVPLGQWWAWLAVGAIVAIAIRRRTMWLLGGILLLLPSSSMFPANDLAADRRMYLPLISFSAAVGLLAVVQGKYVLPAVALVLGSMSFVQSRHWKSESTLWTHVLEHKEQSVRARVHLARAGHPDAVPMLLRAKSIAPDDPLVASELGRMYLEEKRVPEALSEFGRALALEPRNPQAIANRGVALLMLGQRDAARSDFERALQLDPCASGARHNLSQMDLDPGPVPSQCR